MLQFSNRLPALRFHLATLSRFQFIKIIGLFQSTISGGNKQMDSESNSSMEIDGGGKPHENLAGKLSPPTTTTTCTIDSDSDSDSEWHWRCQPIEAVQRGLQPFELDHLGPVLPSGQHKVLFRHPIREPANKPPRPYRSAHKWDAKHVRLPCAPESKYPVEAEDGTSDIDSRWNMIERALLRPISNTKQLQTAILSYNTTYKGQWGFGALHQLFDEQLDESETRVFFEDLLPRIIRLALRLPELIQSAIPLLKQNHTCALTLSQEQISCLLANALLCTFPRRNTLKRKSEYSSFPDINFNRLYQSTGPAVLEKLKCIFHYFRRVCPTEMDASNVPPGCVTFVRLSGKPENLVNWNLSGAGLSSIPIHINAGGTIEDQGVGLLQVDFANMYLGGGVLGQGCVQEEIRFVICPELLVSKLFTECLLPTEALLMVGSERYSNYTGYAGSFVWEGNHEDATPYDSSRRRRTAIVAIDALSFGKTSKAQQYREDLMLRELNKASIGFKHFLSTPAPGVATGNWGCGAFGGDPYLKAILQMMVCAHHSRPLAYFTFGNCQLRDDLYELWQLFRAHGTTVQQMWSVLRRFKKEGAATKSLYQFVFDELKILHKTKSGEKPKETSGSGTSGIGTGGTSGTGTGGTSGIGTGGTTGTETTATSTTLAHSPDLFADDSNDSLFNGVLISDDNDDDVDDDNDDEEQEQANAMMSAASLESCGNSRSSSSNSNSNTTNVTTATSTSATSAAATSATTPNTTTRQLTLLEMLDRHYEQGHPNGSKRQHQSSNSTEKCLKTRKDCQDGDASSGSSNNRY